MKIINQKVQKISIKQLALFLTTGVCLLSVVSLYLYSKLHDLIVSFYSTNPEINLTINSSMEIFAYQMILVFFCLIVLVPLSIFITAKHYKSQMVPLNQQMDALLDGNLEVHRKMRANDEFAPIMDKIHQFSEKLREERSH